MRTVPLCCWLPSIDEWASVVRLIMVLFRLPEATPMRRMSLKALSVVEPPLLPEDRCWPYRS